MELDIRRHPDYPFRSGRRRVVEDRARGVLDPPSSRSPEAAYLREVLVLSHEFAFLERLIQGEVLCDLPAHASRLFGDVRSDPAEEGERLAEAEEDLLGWAAGSVDSLASALDTLGVKVFSLDHGDGDGDDDRGSAEEVRPEPPSDLFGAFSFESGVGPAMLAGAPAETPEALFILAHEFGHLVADVDPYRSRFCQWSGENLDNFSARPEEARADRFARALLMPASAVLRTLQDLGPAPAPGEPDPRFELLATLFGVPEPLVRRRMADLGVPPAFLAPSARVRVRRDPERLPAAGSPRSGSGRGVRPRVHHALNRVDAAAGRLLPLPERFVNLALAAYGGRALDPEVLALFLRTSPEEALEVVHWARVEQEGVAFPKEEQLHEPPENPSEGDPPAASAPSGGSSSPSGSAPPAGPAGPR